VKKLLMLSVVFALLASALDAQELDSVARWATIAASEGWSYSNLVYKKANNIELKLDVITPGPRTEIRPTLVYIHAGGWVAGSKEASQLWTLPFLTRGMNVVNVEYRLGPQSLAPAAVEDCRCALRWVYQHSKEYGFDIAKLVLDGHSAGGHLSLMTGMLDPSAGFDNECPGEEQLRVAAIINNFGITDVAELLQGPNTRMFALMWFGSLSNRMELARKLSPLSYVRAGLPPIISLHGDKDDIVPYQQAVRLHEALDRTRVPNQLVTIPAGGHGGWSRDENLRGQGAIFQFLEKHGILPSQ
jgi:acetyl esterase/lipase